MQISNFVPCFQVVVLLYFREEVCSFYHKLTVLLFSVNMAPFVILSNFGLRWLWKIKRFQTKKARITKGSVWIITAPKVGDFEALPHAVFGAIFAHVFIHWNHGKISSEKCMWIIIIQIPSLLPRNPCLTLSNTRSDNQDYYIFILK